MYIKTYTPGLRYTSSAETEKNWHLRGHRYAITLRQTSPIPPLLIKILHEWRQASMHIVLYSVHCTLYSGRFKRRILRLTTQSQYNTVPGACAHMMCKHATFWNCDWGRGRSAVWRYREPCISLRSQGYKNCSLAWGNSGISQTGVTLPYTINPFGPITGPVFHYIVNKNKNAFI